jgi:effector-binding domain-containing protein/uncharacterized protein YndB with AHSA1/START domain
MLSIPLSLERSVIIAKPIAEIFKSVADFRTWRSWSPWLCMEPESRVSVEGEPRTVGHSQAWQGKVIGSGEMRISSLELNERINHEIQFLAPWKSESQSAFVFTTVDGGTQVTWSMKSQLPLFLFFLRRRMTAYIGADYERGLQMLKEFMEKGEVPTRSEFKGEIAKDGFYYVGKERRCTTQEVGAFMPGDFSELWKLVEMKKLPQPAYCFSLYRTFDCVTGKADYIAGLAYATKPTIKADVPLATGHFEGHRALRLDHTGSYRFLGNAWSALLSRQRALRKKAIKPIPMYEIYRNSPDEVPERQLKTEIYLPVR